MRPLRRSRASSRRRPASCRAVGREVRERCCRSGPNTTIATGRSFLRSARKARDAAIAFWIGAPCMLFDASIRRIAPLLSPPGGVTARADTGFVFSVTFTFDGVQRLRARKREQVRLVREPGGRRLAQLGSRCACCCACFAFWPAAPDRSARTRVGTTSAATAALAIAVRSPSFTPSRLDARRASGRARRTCSAEARCRACGTSRGRRGGGRSA